MERRVLHFAAGYPVKFHCQCNDFAGCVNVWRNGQQFSHAGIYNQSNGNSHAISSDRQCSRNQQVLLLLRDHRTARFLCQQLVLVRRWCHQFGSGGSPFTMIVDLVVWTVCFARCLPEASGWMRSPRLHLFPMTTFAFALAVYTLCKSHGAHCLTQFQPVNQN